MSGVPGPGEGEAQEPCLLDVDANFPRVTGSRGDLPVDSQSQLLPGGAALTGSLLLGGVELVK